MRKNKEVDSQEAAQSKELKILAAAKVNLFLHLTGCRSDGFHNLQSLVYFPSVGDILTLKFAQDFSTKIVGPFAEELNKLPISQNLINRAAKLFFTQYPFTPQVDITLEKNLPLASGIGGGSADAAAVLKGLASFFEVKISPLELVTWGQALGSDVPMCLISAPCWVEGVGEKIVPMPSFPSLFFVLVNPLTPVSTPQVFKRYRSQALPFRPLVSIPWLDTAAAVWEYLMATSNDLTPAALEICPVIAQVLEHLRKSPACILSRLSGSGATCFGLYKDASAASQAALLLKQAHPHWWVKAC